MHIIGTGLDLRLPLIHKYIKMNTLSTYPRPFATTNKILGLCVLKSNTTTPEKSIFNPLFFRIEKEIFSKRLARLGRRQNYRNGCTWALH